MNPNFKIDDEPNIRVNSEVVSLSDCTVSEDNVFVISIYNDGKYPLKVSRIFTSCSCLNLLDHTDEFVVSLMIRQWLVLILSRKSLEK